MAADWKDTLIASLKAETGATEQAAARAQALETLWSELESAVSQAIAAITDALGITLEPFSRKEDGRVRWMRAGRQLSIYLDRAAGRCVATVDLGRGLEMMALIPPESGSRITDDAGNPTTVDAVCERAVSLFFRGAP